jgi:hypothetical protein
VRQLFALRTSAYGTVRSRSESKRAARRTFPNEFAWFFLAERQRPRFEYTEDPILNGVGV